MSTPQEKAKKILSDKLRYADSIIEKIMAESSLTPGDEIGTIKIPFE